MIKLRQLFRYEQASGLLMIAAIVLALLAANSPLASVYQRVHDAQIHVRFGALILEGPLVHWINQDLMVIFFLIVGLEIKRQFLEGYLRCLCCLLFSCQW